MCVWTLTRGYRSLSTTQDNAWRVWWTGYVRSRACQPQHFTVGENNTLRRAVLNATWQAERHTASSIIEKTYSISWKPGAEHRSPQLTVFPTPHPDNLTDKWMTSSTCFGSGEKGLVGWPRDGLYQWWTTKELQVRQDMWSHRLGASNIVLNCASMDATSRLRILYTCTHTHT